MGDKNKHGLTRYIPKAVRRAVRQRCGFGCIFCGRAIIQYHHFDPPFENATMHLADGITLLCGNCHEKEKKGLIGARMVASANETPRCKAIGYTKDDLLFGSTEPRIRFASTEFFCQYPMVYDREIIVGFDAPEAPGAPIRLQAKFCGPTGDPILEIIDNEWRARAELFDLTTIANRLQIRHTGGDVALELTHSSDRGLSLNTLKMSHGDCTVTFIDGALRVSRQGATTELLLGAVLAEVGVYFPPGRGVATGAANIPFLGKSIKDFGPANDLERAMIRCKDGTVEQEAFLSLLKRSDLFVLERLDHPPPPGSFQLLTVAGCLASFSAEHRVEPAKRYLPFAFTSRPVPFSNIVLALPAGNTMVLNPHNPISLPFSTQMIDRLKREVSLRNAAQPSDLASEVFAQELTDLESIVATAPLIAQQIPSLSMMSDTTLALLMKRVLFARRTLGEKVKCAPDGDDFLPSLKLVADTWLAIKAEQSRRA